MEKGKRERSANFTSQEIDILISIVKKYLHVIENKKSDAVMWRKKETAWNNIEADFNSRSGGEMRSSKTLRLKYEGLKCSLRKKTAAMQSEIYRADGKRSRKLELDHFEEQVQSMINFSSDVTENSNDSDDSPLSPSQIPPDVVIDIPVDPLNVTGHLNAADMRSDFTNGHHPFDKQDIPLESDDSLVSTAEERMAANHMAMNKRAYKQTNHINECDQAKLDLLKLQREILEAELTEKKRQYEFNEMERKWKAEEYELKLKKLKKELQECDHNRTLNLDVSGIKVYFYDFQNNYNVTYEIESAGEGITSHYNLDITRRLVIFVPGYKSNINKKTEELVRQTFKDVPNIYLIIIDHSLYTSALGGKIVSYERSVTHVYYIGKALGRFLAGLRNSGFPSSNIHGIGHSLGSQIFAVVGTTYTELTKEKLWRITGIDPAGPCFSNSFINDQIRSGVAGYVEVYHCNAGGLGTTAVLADTDFFFNKKGKKQPDCHEGLIPGKGESDAAKCSHKACVKYYMETVPHPQWYLAWQCDSYDNFSDGRCSGNEVTIAGYNNPGNATGVFYVSTEGYNVR